MKNIHTTENKIVFAKSLLLDLFNKGYSINDIQELGDLLVKMGEEIIENPENTIGKLSNGIIKI